MGRGTPKHQVQSLFRRLRRHVVSPPVRALARNLTIEARMFAAQRSHENVKLREAVEKTLLGSIFRSQDVEKGRRLIIEEKLAGAETEIQIRMRLDLPS